jgi:hypothetical protein
MNIIIKNQKITAYQVEDKIIISDASANLIVNNAKPGRGRRISKEKLVDMGKRYFIKGSLHYGLVTDLDDCYFNNVMLNK